MRIIFSIALLFCFPGEDVNGLGSADYVVIALLFCVRMVSMRIAMMRPVGNDYVAT